MGKNAALVWLEAYVTQAEEFIINLVKAGIMHPKDSARTIAFNRAFARLPRNRNDWAREMIAASRKVKVRV